LKNKGKFIVFEGLECCGKTTQVSLLKDYLESEGIPCITTREPKGSTPISNAIYQILIDPELDGMLPTTELHLILASRYEHLEKVVKPAISEGVTVICDRFEQSTIAYQGKGRNQDYNNVLLECYKASSGMIIDHSIYLDVTVEESKRRVQERKVNDKWDHLDRDFFCRVRSSFLKHFESHEKHTIINGLQSVDEIHNQVKDLINKTVFNEISG